MVDAHLQEIQVRARNNRTLAEELLRSMSAQQMAWNPAPGSWNTLEVIDHLNRTAEKYFDRIQQTISRTRARGLGATGSFRPGFLQGRFIQMLEPKPGSRALPSPGSYRPLSRGEADLALCDRFFEHADAMQSLLREADDVHLSKLRFSSPATPLLRFNIGEAFWLLVAHDNRHLLQIQKICTHDNYPRA